MSRTYNPRARIDDPIVDGLLASARPDDRQSSDRRARAPGKPGVLSAVVVSAIGAAAAVGLALLPPHGSGQPAPPILHWSNTGAGTSHTPGTTRPAAISAAVPPLLLLRPIAGRRQS